jgi:hypothetical protein
MSWRLKDEWINLADRHHYVIFHNPDVLIDYGKGLVPQEHHLMYSFDLAACPHCGAIHAIAGEPVDMEQVKVETLAMLNQHYRKAMAHREKHPRVAIRSDSKK